MNTNQSDALVFFGATGDLAYKKIFPSLQAMIKRGNLNVPVVGVAKAGWNLDKLKARARDSLEKHGGRRSVPPRGRRIIWRPRRRSSGLWWISLANQAAPRALASSLRSPSA